MFRSTKFILFTLLAALLPMPAMAADLVQPVDTEKLLSIQDDPAWVIVDTRLNDAFNGWKLDGVKQGGHIPGATDFSANWLKAKDEKSKIDLDAVLATKGITQEKEVVLYDANGKDAAAVAAWLQKKGFTKLHSYDINSWPADRPLVKYTNYQLIVPAVVVKDILDGKTPETFTPGKKVTIVEASWGKEKTSYAKGHIPTAFHIDTDNIEPPTTTKPVMWMLAPDEVLKKVALKFGFQKDDCVIVTGEEQMAAYRIALVLRYLGVQDVRVLNGGTTAWTMAGYELEKKSHKATPVTDFGAPIPGNPDVIETMAELKQDLNNPNFTLVDNRTWKEHIGESSGYSYHDKKGRIPGSLYGYAGKGDAYSMDWFRNPDKTMRNFNEILQLWKEQGINVSEHLAFMCGSGWRAAEVYYYADVDGLKDISLYSDGWIGWSNAGNPSVSGVPEKE